MEATRLEVIDTPALREYLGPGGPWALECGARVRKYRTAINNANELWLAAAVGVSVQTIRSIESGLLVPRDYLRSAIAFAVGQDPETIWPSLTRRRIGEIGQVA